MDARNHRFDAKLGRTDKDFVQIIFASQEEANKFIKDTGIRAKRFDFGLIEQRAKYQTTNEFQYIVRIEQSAYDKHCPNINFGDLKPYTHLVAVEGKIGKIVTDFQDLVAEFSDVDADTLNQIRIICEEGFYSNEKKINEIMRVLVEGDTLWKSIKRCEKSKQFFARAKGFDLQSRMHEVQQAVNQTNQAQQFYPNTFALQSPPQTQTGVQPLVDSQNTNSSWHNR